MLLCSLGAGERFVAHATADGGRWAGLHGCCDHSHVPLFLSSVIADEHYVGRMHCCWDRCYDSSSGARTEAHAASIHMYVGACKLSPSPAWSHFWIQDGDYHYGILQKVETQELLTSSLLHNQFYVYELETLDIQHNIGHRLHITWAGPVFSSE